MEFYGEIPKEVKVTVEIHTECSWVGFYCVGRIAIFAPAAVGFLIKVHSVRIDDGQEDNTDR